MKDGIIKGDGTSRFIKATLPDTYESFKTACASGAQPLDILMNLAGWDTAPDFLNKENLLQDETEIALFGNAADRTVDAAFRGIAFKFKAISDGLATVKVTITDEGGKPVSGVLLTNVQSDTGGMVLSDASGVVNGYIAEGNAKIAVSGYGDLEDAAVPTFTAVAGGSYTKTLTVKRRTYLNITASKTFRFSGDVATVDVALVDGGDSGGWGNYRTGGQVYNNIDLIGGRGGNAGKAGKQTGIKPEPGKTYQAVVGSGGTDGNAGGNPLLWASRGPRQTESEGLRHAKVHGRVKMALLVLTAQKPFLQGRAVIPFLVAVVVPGKSLTKGRARITLRQKKVELLAAEMGEDIARASLTGQTALVAEVVAPH